MVTHHSNSLAEEVLNGLTAPIKSLPSKLLYDTQGLIFYNEIMGLPEYYLVNSDLQILNTYSKEIVHSINYNDFFYIVDLGAGNADKTKILLRTGIEQNIKFQYMPVDIDITSLQLLKKTLSQLFPELIIMPKEGNYFEILDYLKNLSQPKLVLFLGSSIGNYNTQETNDFLRKLSACLNSEDKLLIGFDLIKDPNIIFSAYNDSKGITKKFNLNLLTRLNKELGADFNLDNFIHYPYYDPLQQAAHSHLISNKEQTVYFEKLNKKIHFYAWESIHTETSYKYNTNAINQLATNNGFQILTNFYDEKKYFVNSLWQIVA